jgi:dTMP kinase
MNIGKYVVLEGIDGSGKTTLSKCLDHELSKHGYKIITSRQPGSTPLGQHLRKLVKTPKLIDQNIEIDELSRQILYMVDTISFNKQILEPAIENGIHVISDRSSYISSIVYGIASGVKIQDINRLLALYPAPKIDRLYIVSCDTAILKSRIKERNIDDHFDSKPESFFKIIENIYSNILTPSNMKVDCPDMITSLISECVNFSDIKYIDSSNGIDSIIGDMVSDLEDNIF